MENSIIEIWQAVPGYEGLYEASDLGNVRSLNYGCMGETKVLSLGICRGYYQVALYNKGKKKYFRVHSLIYTTFKGEIPLGMQVDHINNIKTDNRIENLQLLTPAENARKARLGKTPWNKGKKLNEEYKAKISASMKGKKFSAEHRAKLSAAHKARRERENNQE